MPRQIDLLIHSAAQVVTCANPSGPKRGDAMAQAGILTDGAIAISDGLIVEVGDSAALRGTYAARQVVDARDKIVCPGFVDPHTHLVFAGSRVDEFQRKLAGAGYLDILAAGGGILSTVRATRAASLEKLIADARRRLDAMLTLGTTSIEIKTGYGLDTPTELKMLQAIESLALEVPQDVVPTFLGAHAVPPEYSTDANGYVDLVVRDMLPAVATWRKSTIFADKTLYCDVFCETNAFDYAQSRRVLLTGKAQGMTPKIHADEFTSLGGVALAVDLAAASADHLDVTPEDEAAALAGSDTIAVVLPAVNFHLANVHYANARQLIDAGAALALATDLNPGSAPCLSMPLVMALACRFQKLSPAEAINAATINAAYAIGLGDRLGSLEAGKQADLLLVEALDYRELMYWFGHNLVTRVIKRGESIELPGLAA